MAGPEQTQSNSDQLQLQASHVGVKFCDCEDIILVELLSDEKETPVLDIYLEFHSY